MDSTAEEPSLCIAIAAKGIVNIGSCINSLIKSSTRSNLKLSIHIAHDNELSAPPPTQAKKHPNVSIKFIQCPNATSILKLWGAALAPSSATYVAVIDAHCPPSEKWLYAAEKEIKKGTPVFYGSVEPYWQLDDKKIIGYLIEYAQFKSPIQCDNEYPGNNIVFKAELLETKTQLIEKGFFKTFMLWKLEQDLNTSPLYCDNMSVFYKKNFSLGHYLTRRRDHGRCFGACRLDLDNQPPRWACIGFTPFLFLLRTARIYKWLKQKPSLVRVFFRYLPIILMSEIAWSLGEFLGYSAGENGTCQQLD